MTKEETEFRKNIAHVLKEWAGVDHKSASLEQISKVLKDIHGENERLVERATRSKDHEELKVNETIKKLQENVAELQKQLLDKAGEYAAYFQDLKEKARKAEEAVGVWKARLEEQLSRSDSFKAQALEAMIVVLLRPVGFLRIYGEQAYQDFRTAFINLGGDLNRLPQEVLPPSAEIRKSV